MAIDKWFFILIMKSKTIPQPQEKVFLKDIEVNLGCITIHFNIAY